MKNTNMPLYKAQMGGGTEQSDTMQRLASSIQEAIKRGQTPQAVYESLIARKMDKNMALQLVSSVVKSMMDEGELEPEELDQSEEKDIAAEQQRMQDQQLMEEQNQKDSAAQEQMDTYRQQSIDAAMDTSEADQAEEESMQNTSNILGFQVGGESNLLGQEVYDEQYNADQSSTPEKPLSLEQMIASTPGVQNASFPGLEEYYMPYQPLLRNNNVDYIEFNTPEAKYGGSYKKQFTKNVLSLLKKAEGGPQEDEVTDTSIAKQTDDLTGTVKKKQSSFVDAVGNTAKKVKIDEWFDKLQQTGDPLLQQILTPAPKSDPAQEQAQQVEQMIGSDDHMKRGGQKKRKRKYDRLLNRANHLLGIEEDMPMVGGLPLAFANIPTNEYNKYDNFIDQRYNTIDVPALQKYFSDLAKQQAALQEEQQSRPEIDIYETGIFGRPKKYKVTYPQASSKPVTSNTPVVVNNDRAFAPLVPDIGYIENDGTINPAPTGTMYNPNENTSVAPQNWQDYIPLEIPNAQHFDIGGQYGGFVDPSLPELSRFIYGGDDFQEDAKNVNDPYFKDMGQYQPGGETKGRKQVEPFVTSNRDIYNYRVKKYNDSLAAYNNYLSNKKPKQFTYDERNWYGGKTGKKISPKAVKSQTQKFPADQNPAWIKQKYGWNGLKATDRLEGMEYMCSVTGDKRCNEKGLVKDFRGIKPSGYEVNDTTFAGDGMKSRSVVSVFEPPVQPVRFKKENDQLKKSNVNIKKIQPETVLKKSEDNKPPVVKKDEIIGTYPVVTDNQKPINDYVKPYTDNQPPVKLEEREIIGGPPVDHGVHPFIPISEPSEYATSDGPGHEVKQDIKRYIDWNGNNIGFNGIRFRKPGHGGDLIKKGRRHYLHYPSIEKYNTAEIIPEEYQNGGTTVPMGSLPQNIFSTDMNTTVEAKNGGSTRRQKRRATNMTAWDNLIPANRTFGYTGSYAQQMNLPIEYGTGNIYTGPMSNMPLVGTDVTKRGLFGHPKEWTDYYYINENGVPLSGPVNIPNSSELEQENGISGHAQRVINRADRRADRQIDENLSDQNGYDDLDWRTKMAINRGERQAARIGVDENQFQDGGSMQQHDDNGDEDFSFYRNMEQAMYTPNQAQPMYRRGGYLPMAFEGLEHTPVSYTSNPAFQGQSEVDWTAGTMNTNTNLQPSSFWSDQEYFNQEPPAPNFTQPDQIQINPENIEEYQAIKSTTAPKPSEDIKVAQGKLVGVNRKRQDMRTFDPQALLNMGSTALKTGLGKINQFQSNADQRALYERNFNPMTLSGVKSRIDKGDWEVNQGSKRINETGQNRLGRSKQYGGPMFKEGGQNITYMSEEQIKDFLAAGGELEFL